MNNEKNIEINNLVSEDTSTNMNTESTTSDETPTKSQVGYVVSGDTSTNMKSDITIDIKENNNEKDIEDVINEKTKKLAEEPNVNHPYYDVTNQQQPQNANPYNAVQQPQNANPYNAVQQPQNKNAYNVVQQPQNVYYQNYQQPLYQAQTKKPNKKMSTGIKILIGCIIALFILAIGTVTTLVIFASTQGVFNDFNTIFKEFPNQNGSPFDEFINPTTPTKPDNSSSLVDPNSPGIQIPDQPKDINGNNTYSAGYAFDVCSPSVVGIVVTTPGTEEISEGSGLIISKDGYIVTNSHVIGDRLDNTVEVLLNDEYQSADIVGFDQRTDLAVIKISASDKLVSANFVNSDSLKVGQDVVAIGNPGGMQFSKSVTRGIISALNRQVDDGGNVSYIQTDAAINPGNSGGPLVNLNGEVIGINTIKIVDTEYEGMGFAIPSATVKNIVDDIIKNGYVKDRVKLGVTVNEIDEFTATQNNVPAGVQIKAFDEDNTLENAGVEIDDIITHFEGERIESIAQLYAQLEKHKPNDIVEITLYRLSPDIGDKNEYKVKIKLLESK